MMRQRIGMKDDQKQKQTKTKKSITTLVATILFPLTKVQQLICQSQSMLHVTLLQHAQNHVSMFKYK